MNERDMSLLKLIGETIKQELINQENNFINKINAIKENFESKISELQKQHTTDKQSLDENTKTFIEEQIKQLPAPELPDFEQLINAKIADLAQSISHQELPDIDALITDAISELPKPQDGKSVSIDDVRSVITEEVKKQVAEIPLPKDADPKIVAKELFEIMPQPKDGQDGRDALQIEMMPGIDESKSYPRGTFATHRGGIWRAFQQTTGMHGWECIVNGHYAESAEMKDERTLSIRSEMADGHVNTSEHTIPTMIYCGVYSIEKEYQKGDVVTWGGSLWHCNKPTKDKPGEHNSKGWTLIVKRGRDAK